MKEALKKLEPYEDRQIYGLYYDEDTPADVWDALGVMIDHEWGKIEDYTHMLVRYFLLRYRPVIIVEKEKKIVGVIECVKDVIMEHGGREFTKGKTYECTVDNTGLHTINDSNEIHGINWNDPFGQHRGSDFFQEYFKFVESWRENGFIHSNPIGKTNKLGG